MRPSVVLEMKRSAVREVTGRFRATNPRVFGSVLNGTDQTGTGVFPFRSLLYFCVFLCIIKQ